jgi:hypothetical protein
MVMKNIHNFLFKYEKRIVMNRIIIVLLTALIAASCASTTKPKVEEQPQVLRTNPFDNGIPIIIEVEKGSHFYYPLMVFWIEDTEGNYIETIYASKSIATGTFRFGASEGKKWKSGERRRPAALPYWGHKRGFQAPDGLFLPTPQRPLPDAITGATPTSNFTLQTSVRSDMDKVRIYMEINQTWDWNQYWHNNRFPDDDEYKTSCQPALVYMVEVDFKSDKISWDMIPIGHSHPSGKTGELFKDISNHTTALQIVEKITVKTAP